VNEPGLDDSAGGGGGDTSVRGFGATGGIGGACVLTVASESSAEDCDPDAAWPPTSNICVNEPGRDDSAGGFGGGSGAAIFGGAGGVGGLLGPETGGSVLASGWTVRNIWVNSPAPLWDDEGGAGLLTTGAGGRGAGGLTATGGAGGGAGSFFSGSPPNILPKSVCPAVFDAGAGGAGGAGGLLMAGGGAGGAFGADRALNICVNSPALAFSSSGNGGGELGARGGGGGAATRGAGAAGAGWSVFGLPAFINI